MVCGLLSAGNPGKGSESLIARCFTGAAPGFASLGLTGYTQLRYKRKTENSSLRAQNKFTVEITLCFTLKVRYRVDLLLLWVTCRIIKILKQIITVLQQISSDEGYGTSVQGCSPILTGTLRTKADCLLYKYYNKIVPSLHFLCVWTRKAWLCVISGAEFSGDAKA